MNTQTKGGPKAHRIHAGVASRAAAPARGRSAPARPLAVAQPSPIGRPSDPAALGTSAAPQRIDGKDARASVVPEAAGDASVSTTAQGCALRAFSPILPFSGWPRALLHPNT